jgi:hypothetical protein
LCLCAARRRALAAEPASPAEERAPADRSSRSDELFHQARRLRAEGDIAGACARFDESYHLAPRGGTLLNLGLCHEELGSLLAAQRELRLALEMARREGRADREPIATQHLAAVEARLSWLRLGAPTNVAPGRVRWSLDGAPVAPGQDRVPVEAGSHTVSAAAEGFRARTVTVEIGAASEQRAVEIGALERIDPTPAAVATPPRPLQASAAPPAIVRGAPISVPPDVRPPVAGASRTLARVALVTGIAGVAVSLGAGALALSRKSIVQDRKHCDPMTKLCDPEGQAAASTGRAAVITGTVAFAVGVAGWTAWVFVPGGLLRPARGGASAGDHTLGLSFTRFF